MARPDYYGNPAGATSDIEVVRAIYAAFEDSRSGRREPASRPRTASST